MKSSFLLAVVAFSTINFGLVFAQTNDMAIMVSKSDGISPPNSRSTISITIENLGPDSNFGVFLVDAVSPQGPLFLSQPVNYTFLSGPCSELPADVLPGDAFGAWTSPTLNSGQTATCLWEFTVDAVPFADPVLVTWTVSPNGGRLTDLNQTNNNHSLLFKFSSTASIPTMMKPAVGFLLFVVLLMGFRGIEIRD